MKSFFLTSGKTSDGKIPWNKSKLAYIECLGCCGKGHPFPIRITQKLLGLAWISQWFINTHTIHGTGIFTYIWCFLMGNVSKWTIHWWFWDTYLNLLGKPKRLLIKAHGKFRRIFPGFFPAPLSFTKLGILRLPPFFPTKVDPYRKNRIQNKRQWKNQKIKC